MPAKGTSLSIQSIEQMKASKLAKLKSKYNWNIIDPYLDKEINISSRNRVKTFITLREFKKLIEEGVSLKEVRKMTSKHLIQFYSNLSQGKIHLSKEKFAEEYKNGLKLFDIAEKYKISKDDIGFLRQLYGKKSTGAKYQDRMNTEVPLTQRQKDILYGSMMGDAKKQSPSSVSFGHSEQQKDYLFWKHKNFENIASEKSFKCTTSIDKRSERENKKWGFYTYANTDVEKCIMEFYKSGEKEVNEEILEKLTPLSIAIWFCDDGKMSFSYRSKTIKNYNSNPYCCLCTESFSKQSCELIAKWFETQYNIKTYLKEKPLSNKMGYRINIDCENTSKFITLIKNYIPSMFNYKIDFDAYVEYRKEKETQKIGDNFINCPLGVDFSALNMKKQDYYIHNFVDYFQKQGIDFLINKPDSWERHMSLVIRYDTKNLMRDGFIDFSHIGNKFLMSHFPNYWEAKAKGSLSPKEIFENKEYLSEIIRKIITDGYFPNEQKILRGLRRYRGNKQASGFMPLVAKTIYNKYCDENSKVFDFCGGYGGRLFGALSCDKVKSYSAIELNFESYCGLNDLYRTLRLHGNIEKEVTLFNQDSILGMSQFVDKSFDFCFTSPPYYNAEEYDDDKHQSSIKYHNYSDWFEKYLIGAIKEARRISKKVAINIANTGGYKIADDLRKWLNDNNINFIEDQLRSPQFGGKWRFEPVFVF